MICIRVNGQCVCVHAQERTSCIDSVRVRKTCVCVAVKIPIAMIMWLHTNAMHKWYARTQDRACTVAKLRPHPSHSAYLGLFAISSDFLSLPRRKFGQFGLFFCCLGGFRSPSSTSLFLFLRLQTSIDSQFDLSILHNKKKEQKKSAHGHTSSYETIDEEETYEDENKPHGKSHA